MVENKLGDEINQLLKKYRALKSTFEEQNKEVGDYNKKIYLQNKFFESYY